MILRPTFALWATTTLLLTHLPTLSLSESPDTIPADLPVSKILTLASTSLSSGNSQQALSYFDIAASRDPQNYLTYFKRGATYLSLGRSSAALKDFDKVLFIRPGFEGALTQRAKIHGRNGDWEAARRDYTDAGKKGDSEEVTEMTEGEEAAKKARDASRKREWETCVTQASRAIMTAVTSLELRRLRTKCRLEKGEVLEAVGDLQQVMTLNPGANEPPMQIAAMLFYSLNEREKGSEAVKRCLRSDPDSKPCNRLFKRQKRVEKTVRKIQELLEKRQFSSAVGRLVGQGEEEPGLLEEVESDMKEYRQEGVIHQKAPEELLADLLEVTCDAFLEVCYYSIITTRSLWRRLLNKGPLHFLSYSARNNKETQMNNHKRAQPHCTRLHALNPTSLPALLHEATSQLHSEDPEAALRALQNAVDNASNPSKSTPPSLHQSRQQRLQKLQQEAQTALKRAKTKDYYKVLEVPRSASAKDVKKAYRRLSKEHHPDKVAAPEARPAAEKKMASINEAYEVLKDPELKARFDSGEDPNDPMAGRQQGPPGGGGFPFGPQGGQGGGQQFFFQQGPGGGQQRQFVFKSGGGPGAGFQFPGGFQFG